MPVAPDLKVSLTWEKWLADLNWSLVHILSFHQLLNLIRKGISYYVSFQKKHQLVKRYKLHQIISYITCITFFTFFEHKLREINQFLLCYFSLSTIQSDLKWYKAFTINFAKINSWKSGSRKSKNSKIAQNDQKI